MNDEYGDRKKLIGEDSAGFQMKPQTEDATKISLAAQTFFIEDNDLDTLLTEDELAEKEEPSEWKMPEPIFRTSSGKSFKKSDNQPPSDLLFSETSNSEENLNAAPVKPQANDKITEKSTVNLESDNFNKIFVVLTAVILVVALLATLYFWLFYKSQV